MLIVQVPKPKSKNCLIPRCSWEKILYLMTSEMSHNYKIMCVGVLGNELN